MADEPTLALELNTFGFAINTPLDAFKTGIFERSTVDLFLSDSRQIRLTECVATVQVLAGEEHLHVTSEGGWLWSRTQWKPLRKATDYFRLPLRPFTIPFHDADKLLLFVTFHGTQENGKAIGIVMYRGGRDPRAGMDKEVLVWDVRNPQPGEVGVRKL